MDINTHRIIFETIISTSHVEGVEPSLLFQMIIKNLPIEEEYQGSIEDGLQLRKYGNVVFNSSVVMWGNEFLLKMRENNIDNGEMVSYIGVSSLKWYTIKDYLMYINISGESNEMVGEFPCEEKKIDLSLDEIIEIKDQIIEDDIEYFHRTFLTTEAVNYFISNWNDPQYPPPMDKRSITLEEEIEDQEQLDRDILTQKELEMESLMEDEILDIGDEGYLWMSGLSQSPQEILRELQEQRQEGDGGSYYITKHY